MRPRAWSAWLAAGMLAGACTREDPPSPERTPASPAAEASPSPSPSPVTPDDPTPGVVPRGDVPSDPGPLAYDPNGPEPTATTRSTVPHRRPDGALSGRVDVVKALEPSQAGLASWRALSATAAVPAWAYAETWDPRGARDDDARTDWRCKSTGEAVCGWMVAFETPAEVAAIRLVVGRGKVRQFRLHTDAGTVELPPLPNVKPRWIVLDPPVKTRTIALEAVRPGSVRLAEVELYGPTGPARAPWTFDPTSAAVLAEEPWHEFEGSWRLGRYLCLTVLDAGVTPRCLFRGTAMYGHRGDRYALQEAIHRTDCEHHAGVYVLVDLATRRRIKLGPAWSPPAAVHLHREGEGFAIARDDGSFVAVVAGASGVTETKLADLDALTAAGFEPTAAPRGEFALRAPVACPEGFPFSDVAALDAEGDAPSPDPPTPDRPTPAGPELPGQVAALPTAAREAIIDELEWMCVDDVDRGNFDGTGLDDYLVHMHQCDADDAISSTLLIATDLGDYLALEVPGIGAGGHPSFDRLASGKRVLLVDDDCCGIHSVAIVEKGRGSILEVTEKHEAGEDEEVEIRRDAQGRILEIKVR